MFGLFYFVFSNLIIRVVAAEEDANICDLVKSKRGIDLTQFGTLSVELHTCSSIDHHTIRFNLCDDLDSPECLSEGTIGPGNACDSYEDLNFYWVGGISGAQYDDEQDTKGGKQTVILYEGIKQTIKSPFWTRSLEMTLVCDNDVEEEELTCLEVSNHDTDEKTLYQIQMKSKKLCVGGSPLKTVVIVVGIVFGVCVVGVYLLALLCCCVIFFAGGYCAGRVPRGYRQLGGKKHEEELEDEDMENDIENNVDDGEMKVVEAELEEIPEIVREEEDEGERNFDEVSLDQQDPNQDKEDEESESDGEV